MLYKLSLEKVICEKLSAFACEILSQSNISSESENIRACKTCLKAVKKDKIPPQALCNGLAVKQIPKELSILYDLELQVNSLVMPFMKIVAKPRGMQQGILGAVVLVLTQLKQITNILPRTLGQCDVITLALKTRLTDINSTERQYVRPNLVNDALQYLMTTNSLYRDVEVNDSWIEQIKGGENEGLIKDFDEESNKESHIDSPDYVTDSEDEVDEDNKENIVEELQNKGSINNNTCMHPIDGPSPSAEKVFNIAPGKGQTPLNVFSK